MQKELEQMFSTEDNLMRLYVLGIGTPFQRI